MTNNPGIFSLLAKLRGSPTPPAAVPVPPVPNPPPAAALQETPTDDRIHSQLYWKRRVKFLESLEVWTRNELIAARTAERITTEAPSTPATRRERGPKP